VSAGTGGTATATSSLSSPYTAVSDTYATGGNGATAGTATATSTAVGTSLNDSNISANAEANSANGTTGGIANATANSTSIGATTGQAQAQTVGASGNVVANSTALNAVSGATNTVLASATSPTTGTTGYALTYANVGGSWFGNPENASNGYAAYGLVMGSPTASVISQIASSAVAPIVAASLSSSGSSIFGAGVLGANYTTSTGTITSTATNTHEYSLSGTNSFTLGLLTMGAYNSGFSSLTFTVAEGSTTLLSKSFTSLSSAETYFTDDPVSLGNITGAVDLTLTFSLTASTAEGAGISYVVADGPSSAIAKPLTSPKSATAAATLPASRADGRWGAARTPGQTPSLSTALWAFDSTSGLVGKSVVKPLLRNPERVRTAPLLKGRL
jgi:hypothetical protein